MNIMTSGVSASTSRGISGLMSGLDTSTIVKDMTYSVRSKIAKKMQEKQLFVWKTEAYRSIASNLVSFSNQFLSYGSSTNALSSNFYTSTAITAKGKNADAVSVTGTNASNVNNLSILSTRTATKANYMTSKSASDKKITSKTVDFTQNGYEINNLAGKTLSIRYGGSIYSITIDSEFSGTGNAAAADAINSALKEVALNNSAAGEKLFDAIEADVDSDGKLLLRVKNSNDTTLARVLAGTGGAHTILGFEANKEFSANSALKGDVDKTIITSRYIFNDSEAGKNLVLEYNGVRKSITLAKIDYTKSDPIGSFMQDLQSKIDNAFGSGKISVGHNVTEPGKAVLTFETADPMASLKNVTSQKLLGVDPGIENRLNMNLTAAEAGLTNGSDNIKLEINGVTKTFDGSLTIKQIIDQINSGNLGVNIQYIATADKFIITSTETGANSRIDIKGAVGGGSFITDLFGKGVAANAQFTTGNEPVNLGYKITTGAVNFADNVYAGINKLAGEEIKITYNGVEYTAKIDENFNKTSINDVVAALNAAFAKAEDIDENSLSTFITAKAEGGKISLKFVDEDDTNTATIQSATGDLLSILGLNASVPFEADTPLEGNTFDASTVAPKVGFEDSTDNKKLTFNLGGTEIEIDLSLINYSGGTPDFNTFLSSLNSGVLNGTGITASADFTDPSNVTFSFVSDSALEVTKANALLGLNEGAESKFNLDVTAIDAGFANADGNVYLTINGQDITFDGSLAIQEIIDEINDPANNYGLKVEYLSGDNRFVVTATEAGASGRVEISDTDSNTTFISKLFGSPLDYSYVEITNSGRDAEMVISYGNGTDPITVTRSTNSFEIDGLTITTLSDFDTGEAITFDKKVNSEEIFENIMSVIDEYNAMIDLISNEVIAKYDSDYRDYRDYPPLTAEQRAEMSEKEIEDWEEIAKKGLLTNDPTLRALMSELRFVLPSNAYTFGITTSTDWRDNGKIVMTDENKAKLRKAIEENPDAVKDIFIAPRSATQKGGIMTSMKEITDKYAGTLGVNKGPLIRLSGMDSLTNPYNSYVATKLRDFDKAIDALQRTQKTQEDRYYRQYTALEKYMAQITAQSSWLSQQFGGATGN